MRQSTWQKIEPDYPMNPNINTQIEFKTRSWHANNNKV